MGSSKQKTGIICTSLFSTLLLLAAVMPAHAQYNDSTHYYAALASSGIVNNTDENSSYLLNNNLKLGVRKKDLALNLANGWVYGNQNRTVTNNDYNSTLDFNIYKFIPHAYYWGVGNYTSSVSLKISNQAQVGAGVAYNIFDRKNIKFNISDGLLYEYSDILIADTMRTIYSVYRNSLRFQLKCSIGKVVTVNGVFLLQSSLSDSKDYIIKSNIEAKLKLRKWLSFTAAYAYNSFSLTGKENSLITYGLLAERYF